MTLKIYVNMPSFKIGAHVSIAGGIFKAPQRVRDIGGNVLQIFSSSPRTWQGPDRDDEIERFKQAMEDNETEQVFIHAKHLISLGNEKDEIRQKSINSLKEDLLLSQKIGAEGVIFHPRGEEDLIIDSLSKVLEDSLSSLIVENTAQSNIGSISRLFKNLPLELCLDTAHAFEAGHNLSNKEGLDDLIEQIEREIGLERLVVVHTNDSLTKMGSRHDRHANIGEGEIGEKMFKYLVNHPKLKNLPFILEVPALKGGGGAEDIKLLRDLRLDNL